MSARVITLPDVLDLVALRPLHQELIAARGGDLVVEAAGVQRVSGLALQLLASAEMTWAHDGRKFDLYPDRD